MVLLDTLNFTDELMYCLKVFLHPLILQNDKKSLHSCVFNSILCMLLLNFCYPIILLMDGD